jgi:hypothetical protein
LSQIVPIITNLTNSLELTGNLDDEDFNDETINSDLEENLIVQQINYSNIGDVLENVKEIFIEV